MVAPGLSRPRARPLSGVGDRTLARMSATTADERLSYETRTRPRVAVIAVVAGALLLVTAILQTVGPKIGVQEATLVLITENKRAGLDILAGVVNTIGSLAIAAALVYLIDSARARNQTTPSWLRILAIVGAVLSAVAGLIYAIEIADKAHQFVSSGTQTYPEAHQLTSGGLIVALPAIALVGALLVAMAFVLVSLQAMRVGLLTRFMGYLGMFAGVLVLFPLIPLPVVEIYWFLALAVLLGGRWPNGEPASWRTGRAERWPTAQELREQRIRAAGGTAGKPAGRLARKGLGAGRGSQAAASETPVVAAAPARTPQKRKRKRKR